LGHEFPEKPRGMLIYSNIEFLATCMKCGMDMFGIREYDRYDYLSNVDATSDITCDHITTIKVHES